MTQQRKIVGVGSPIVDLLIQIPEAFLANIDGAKGGMELVDSNTIDSLVTESGLAPDKAPGGSAANTIFALAHMGMPTAFIGKLGMDDDGGYYQEMFRVIGGNVERFRYSAEVPTARCLSLITPDSERTMRTDLGAAVHMTPSEIEPADFAEFDHAHIEGYLLFNAELAERALYCAKNAGCTVSLDLGSFEVVRAAQSILPGLLEKYVDAVFANEDEAAAYCGHQDPESALKELGTLCHIAAVKLGAKGAWLKRGEETLHCNAIPVTRVVDTTGAGDCWAAGFLYGHLNAWPLQKCGDLAALLGGEVVQEIGASPNRAAWSRIREQITTIH